MARTAVAGFIGGSNRLRASNQDVEDTINFYVEPTAPGSSKVTGGLLPTPCLRYKATVTGGTAGVCSFQQDGRYWTITNRTTDAVLTEWDSSFVGTTRAVLTKATTALPASMVSNGSAGGQMLIVCGGNGYVYDLTLNTVTLINGTNYPATGFPVGIAKQCEFLDGYGVVLVVDSRQFQICGLQDFTSWDPLDVAQRSEGSDNLVGVIRNHRELWFPGTKTGEVWYDSGDALFPFAPVPGVFLEYGAASASLTRVSNTIAWIGLDERGWGVVNLADGYTPKTTSTIAVAENVQTLTSLQTIQMFSQQQGGHTFVWVRSPNLNWTWAYDLTTDTWCKRTIWNTTTCQHERHPANTYAFAFNKHMVTSALNGAIYELDPTAYADEIAA